MSYIIKDIIKIIEDFAPLDTQADFDNSGIICGDINKQLEGVLITLDNNEAVVEEAIREGCNIIIEHHPSIFYPIKRIDYRLPLHKTIMKAIKHDIAIYACHTNIDFTQGGLNDYVANKLELKNIYCHNDDISSARIGYLNNITSLGEYAKKVGDILGDNNIQVIGNKERKISKVAVINGGGGGDTNLIIELDNEDVDVFITGDIKYAFARFAKDYNYAIINFGHYESEIYFLELIEDLLKSNNKDIKIIKTSQCLNPYNKL